MTDKQRPIFDVPLTDDERKFLSGKDSRMCGCFNCPLHVDGDCCEPFSSDDNLYSCSEVRAAALKLDDERNRKVEDKQLPTESELREEMEKDSILLSKLLSKHFDGGYSTFHKNTNQMWMIINGRPANVGVGKKFRPDLVAPAKGRIVLGRNIAGESTYIGFSIGRFYHSGELVMAEAKRKDGTYRGGMSPDSWCDLIDRFHHSPNWKREWEPDYKGNE